MGKQKKNISRIREKTHNGVDNIMDKAGSVGDRGKETIANLKEKGMIVKKNVDGYIQKNPERSVLIAAGIGIAAGAILTATMTRKRQSAQL